jgi:hypothetical protein
MTKENNVDCMLSSFQGEENVQHFDGDVTTGSDYNM